jgi:protein subunit release factor A
MGNRRVGLKELLFSVTKKDLEINYFSGTGGGGQHRNKHQNCVRLKHAESGVMVTGQSEKSRQANLREALNNLVAHPKFRMWQAGKAIEIVDGKNLEQRVEQMMTPEKMKIECRDEDGKWVPI